MENDRIFQNCVTLDKKIKMSNFRIQLCLGCSFDLQQDICQFSPKFGLNWDSVVLLFENNREQRKTIKTIEIVKNFLTDVISL